MAGKKVAAQRDRLDKATSVLLAASRKDRDMNQQQLADRLGWTRDMVANVESGRKAVTLRDFVHFCEVLDLDAQMMLGQILTWNLKPSRRP
jgi:transcriptional regulator with XRE-family HTH domain